jgi:hypothetical protein
MSTPNLPPIPQPVTKAGAFNYSALAARVVVFGVFCCSLGLIWWSYYRVFFPHLQQFHELTSTVTKLNSDLDQLNHRWTPGQIAQINASVGMIQTNFFADQVELQSWLAEVREQSQPLGLDVKADFTPSHVETNAQPKFAVISTGITIQFRPPTSPAKGPSRYQELLELAQRITTREKTDCLNELTVETGPNSIDRAVMNFNFWVAINESK